MFENFNFKILIIDRNLLKCIGSSVSLWRTAKRLKLYKIFIIRSFSTFTNSWLQFSLQEILRTHLQNFKNLNKPNASWHFEFFPHISAQSITEFEILKLLLCSSRAFLETCARIKKKKVRSVWIKILQKFLKGLKRLLTTAKNRFFKGKSSSCIFQGKIFCRFWDFKKLDTAGFRGQSAPREGYNREN